MVPKWVKRTLPLLLFNLCHKYSTRKHMYYILEHFTPYMYTSDFQDYLSDISARLTLLNWQFASLRVNNVLMNGKSQIQMQISSSNLVEDADA